MLLRALNVVFLSVYGVEWVSGESVNVRGVASRMPLRLKPRGYRMAMDQSTCASTVYSCLCVASHTRNGKYSVLVYESTTRG